MIEIGTSNEFALPDRLEPELAELLAYWDGIKRGFRIMPYWDDVAMDRLSGLRDRLAMWDVLDDPPRFRFSIVGARLDAACADELAGRFTDELSAAGPLAHLTEQCRAAVAEAAPTYFRQADDPAFARLILPLWGEGRIRMLIGAIAGPAVAG